MEYSFWLEDYQTNIEDLNNRVKNMNSELKSRGPSKVRSYIFYNPNFFPNSPHLQIEDNSTPNLNRLLVLAQILKFTGRIDANNFTINTRYGKLHGFCLLNVGATWHYEGECIVDSSLSRYFSLDHFREYERLKLEQDIKEGL